MPNSIKFLLTITILSFVMSGPYIVSAEEEALPSSRQDIIEIIDQDEDIQSQDLGISDPKILPNSPFYFFKNLGRGIQSTFTFGAVDKAELKLKFTNEKIIEAKKLSEKTQNAEILKKGLENYKSEMNRLKTATDKIKEISTENVKVDKFLDKLIDQNLKQQKLLGKLEKELPQEAFEKIKETKEENLAKFSEIAARISENPEVLEQKLINNIEKQEGSQFKNFKNLEILKSLEDKVPEQALPAIQKAQNNALKRLHNDLTAMSPEDQEKFKDYIKNIGGDEIRHLQVINGLEGQAMPENVRQRLEDAKEATFEKTERKIKMLNEQQKERFLRPFEEGKIENLETIKDLENNLAPEASAKITELKDKATRNFRNVLENAKTLEQKEMLLKNAWGSPTIKTFEVLKEASEKVPPEKQKIFEEMKDKAAETIKSQINEAKGPDEKRMIMQLMSSDALPSTQILKELNLSQEISSGLKNAAAEKMERKIQLIEDPQKLEILKQRIEKDNPAGATQNLSDKIERKIEKNIKNINPEKPLKRINEVKERKEAEPIKQIEADKKSENGQRGDKNQIKTLPGKILPKILPSKPEAESRKEPNTNSNSSLPSTENRIIKENLNPAAPLTK